MICACELLATRLEALTEKEEKEKQRIIDAERARERIIQHSIDFCETEVNNALNEMAKNPNLNDIHVRFFLDCTEDKYGNTILRPLLKQKIKYADGRSSYIPSDEKHYSKQVIEDYLSQHCLSVQWAEGVYYTYRHGPTFCKVLHVEVKI